MSTSGKKQNSESRPQQHQPGRMPARDSGGLPEAGTLQRQASPQPEDDGANQRRNDKGPNSRQDE